MRTMAKTNTRRHISPEKQGCAGTFWWGMALEQSQDCFLGCFCVGVLIEATGARCLTWMLGTDPLQEQYLLITVSYIQFQICLIVLFVWEMD